jgi:hypothetical protein
MMGPVAKISTRIAALCIGMVYVASSLDLAFNLPSRDGWRETLGFVMGLCAYFACGTFLIGIGLGVAWTKAEEESQARAQRGVQR